VFVAVEDFAIRQRERIDDRRVVRDRDAADIVDRQIGEAGGQISRPLVCAALPLYSSSDAAP
jgi:hypothetical protein